MLLFLMLLLLLLFLMLLLFLLLLLLFLMLLLFLFMLLLLLMMMLLKFAAASTVQYKQMHLSFIHSGHFYSAPLSPLLLGGAPDYSTDTVSEFHAEAHRQLQVKDLPKVPT